MKKLSNKAKVGIGAGITAAGIAGILWGIFGGRKKTMTEDDFEICDADELDDSDSDADNTEES